MNISDHDNKIQAAIDEKDSLYKKMEDLVAGFEVTCTEFFTEDFPITVERAITALPDVTQSLGLESLRELKLELKLLVEKIPKIVTQELNQNSIWEHRNELPEWSLSESLPGFNLRHKAGDRASKQLHVIKGHVGTLLLKYGLAKAGRDEAWENNGKVVRYRYSIGHSDERFRKFPNNYKNLFNQFVTAHMNIQKAERNKEEAGAKSLWDQA
ncbi:MAG: hypothetical protein ACKVQW_04615 [Pyrinomonadaceae bacterium]